MTLGDDNPYRPPAADAGWNAGSDGPGLRADAFHALLPRLWTRDSFYRVYVTERGLYAAWVAGQFHDKGSVRFQMWFLYPLLVGFAMCEPWANRILARRRELEKRYDQLVETPATFLDADARNFSLPAGGISGIVLDGRKPLHTMGLSSNGTIVIDSAGKKPLRLIIRDPLGVAGVRKLLVKYGYAVRGKS